MANAQCYHTLICIELIWAVKCRMTNGIHSFYIKVQRGLSRGVHT